MSVEDAALKGSEENINEVDQVLSTYQMRVNKTSLEADAFLTCANNTFFECDQHLSSEIDAFRAKKELIFKKEQQNSAAQIKELDKIMGSKHEDEKWVFMHQFHSESLQEGIDLLLQDVSSYLKSLTANFQEYLTDKFDPRVQEFYKDYSIDQKNIASH